MRRGKPTAYFTDGDLGTLGRCAIPAEHRRLSVALARQGGQLFSGTELQHGFVIGLLELFELFFVLFADIQVCLTGWLQSVLNNERLRIARPVFKLLLCRR